MASESSSAVLDLNDADGEDTEPASMTDDAQDGTPLIMEHGYDIAVKVDAPMKQMSTLETFVTYRVRCVCARWQSPPAARRRYNHFKVLHKRLSRSHPLIAIPPLPPLHSARQQLDRYSPSFVAIRASALNAFLDRVAKHPILTHSEDFRAFIVTPDEELDKVFKSDSNAMNLWGLSNALYGSGETKPVNGARVKDPEFTAATDYLQSLQQKLSTLCSLTNKLTKGNAALSTEYEGMSRLCSTWSGQSPPPLSTSISALSRAASRRAGAAVGFTKGAGGSPAVLPLLAAYCAAHVEKIRQRDAVHAAYVSGNNTTEDLHNRLEQASEALRSELSDWVPKTRSEIKSLLLDLADRQVNIHTQSLVGWEQALRQSSQTDIHDMFKTVSKTAVQNLSPSRCRADDTPTETEVYDNLSNDSFAENCDRNNGEVVCDPLNAVDELSNDLSKVDTDDVSKLSNNVDDISNIPDDMSKLSNMPDDASKESNLPDDMSKLSNIPDDMSKLSNIPDDMSKESNLPDDMSKLSNIPDDMSKLTNNADNESSKLSNDMSKLSNNADDTSKLSNVTSDPLRDFSDVDLSS